MEFDSLNSLEKRELLLKDVRNAIEVGWINPAQGIVETGAQLGISDVNAAEHRFERWAPLVMKLFPETVATNGIVESPLTDIPNMKKALTDKLGNGPVGRMMLKQDNELPIAGSVKARGGLYAVLRIAEDLARKHGIIKGRYDDMSKLASKEAKALFAKHKLQVGSTGNLGISIGVIGAALGFETIVHMSRDAKAWKKEYLRNHGVKIIEYNGSYSTAVQMGRMLSASEDNSFFVDDEKSVDLFLGYSVAGKRLADQLEDKGIQVNKEHPLFVYIPCGVGGAPGGIAFALKLIYGKNVHVFFVEPTQAPSMLLGIVTGMYNQISVKDIGLTGVTAADGLAVGRTSGFVGPYMRYMVSGEFTVKDSRLPEYMRKLYNSEGIFVEPSAAAAFHPLAMFAKTSTLSEYAQEIHISRYMDNATHIVWATGGRLVPETERQELMKKEEELH